MRPWKYAWRIFSSPVRRVSEREDFETPSLFARSDRLIFFGNSK